MRKQKGEVQWTGEDHRHVVFEFIRLELSTVGGYNYIFIERSFLLS